jgi:hypothetical protein
VGEQKVVRGRILNALMNLPVEGAAVQFRGNVKTATTAKNGSFVLGPVYVDCSELNYLQVEKPGFYRNRVDFACDSQERARSYYIFNASHVDGLAIDARTEMHPDLGIILGHTNFGHAVKMQLWGPDEINPNGAARGVETYFDNDGVLNGDLDRSTKSGNFAIFEAPDGLSYIQAFDPSGRTLSFWPILTSASTVNVYAQ